MVHFLEYLSMPANPKYLSSTGQRIGKVSAAILGGFLVTMAVHVVIGIFLVDKSPMVLTTIWSAWLMWVGLMIYAFTFEKAWKVWALYLGITTVLGIVIYCKFTNLI